MSIGNHGALYDSDDDAAPEGMACMRLAPSKEDTRPVTRAEFDRLAAQVKALTDSLQADVLIVHLMKMIQKGRAA